MHLTKSAHGTRIVAGIHRRFWRFALALAVGAPCLQSSWAGTIFERGPSLRMAASWSEELMTWLQAIMRFLGGDAGTLSPDPSIAMTQITAYYNVHGTPPGLSSEQKATGRLEVEAAWMLTSSPLAGSDASVVGFRRTLKKLYADLGGDPNTL